MKTPGVDHWSTSDAPALSTSGFGGGVLPDEPARYTVLGLWGRGLGSRAFHFVTRSDGRRVFLRLAYGGAFGKEDEQAREIVRAVEAYDALVRAPRLVDAAVTYSIGNGTAELVLAGGSVVACDVWAVREGMPPGPAPQASELLAYLLRRVEAFDASRTP